MSDQTGSWQPDPHGRHQYRWWDGNQWTDQVSDDGAVSTDPVGSLEGGSAAAASDAGDPSAGSESTPSQPDAWGQPDPTTAMPASGAGGVGGGATPSGAAPTGGGEPPKKSSNTPVLVLGGVILLLLIGAGAWLLLGGDDDEDGEPVAADGGAVSDTADSDTADEGEGDSDGSDSDGDDGGSDSGDSDSGGDIDLDNPFVEAMIDGMMQGSDLTEEQARCFSEGLLDSDEFDMQELAENPDAAAGPEMMGLMFEIFEECDINPLEMGGGTDSDPGDFSVFEEGDTYGDNPQLDALWDACEDGDGEACNELYMSSEVGSEYEEFGATCGGRNESEIPLTCEQ